MKKPCTDLKINHKVVSIENHRANGRVERVIWTIREGTY